MTQEQLDKLHKLEEQRKPWIEFKKWLNQKRNVSVSTYSNFENIAIAMINLDSDYANGFQEHILKFVDGKINEINTLIEEL
ncbi:MAG: hypothetical protein J6Y37_00075 [Paludibacteraceae bacterium]|nr:hypothetical protein [Paludibacteraceae bacterium]